MKKLFFVLLALFLFGKQSFAQEDTIKTRIDDLEAKIEELKGALDGLNESYLETKTTAELLKKIKVSGYIQTQFQSAEMDGVSSFSGGNFGAGIHNRLMIRRGRVKFNYDNDLTQYVLQLDATEKGLGLKDAYVSFKEPWLKTFGITGGVFDRPFGFEISYSSSRRESPERSRLFQSLFPGERDLGMKLEISSIEGIFSYINFKGGFFAGNGINVETDNHKDFIGRLGFSLPFTEENLAIDGGVSIYSGSVVLPAGKSLITVNNPNTATTQVGVADPSRSYTGIDLQLYYELPILGRFTLRGEYISGQQPGTSSSNASFTSLPTGDLYLRNFAGYYLMWVQNLGEKDQFVLKYDSYDPNTDVSGAQINLNPAAKLGVGDIKYTTLGLGLVHYWDDNVKFILYYDNVSNEECAYLKGYEKDLSDNVFTFRIQYSF